MLFYIILLFPLTLYAFFFQNSPCSCAQINCLSTTSCPESTLPNTVINSSPLSSYQLSYNTPPCSRVNDNIEYESTLPPYQQPSLITSSYSPIKNYEYQEIPQSQSIYVQPNQIKGNDIDSYQTEQNYNIHDMTATVDNYSNNILQPQRDSLNKDKVFTDKTSINAIDKKKTLNKTKSSFKSLCNDSKLARIMAEAIVSDISISKLLISDAVSIAYNNVKANVICASGDFSYSVLVQKEYCEATKGKVTCFAYL